MWGWYNATDTPANFVNLPTVAYSGENDKQKQAADVMARAMLAGGMELTHVIGAKAGHNYTPEAKKVINAKIDALAARGKPAVPRSVALQTYTLRYNKAAWVEVLGLEKHWEPAQVLASIAELNVVTVHTRNVTSFRLNFGPGEWPAPGAPLTVNVQPKALADAANLAPPYSGFSPTARSRSPSASRPRAWPSGTGCKARSTTRSWTRS